MTVKIAARRVGMQFKVTSETGKRDSISVLDDFELEVKEGEFLAILGPSGCGKSTFLNILAGLSRQTEGDIVVDGESVNGVNKKHGVVFQGYALFPWRTVLQNVEVGLQIRGLRSKERKEIARQYIQLVGLQAFENRYPHELSGGMRQRVAIARSLAYQPDVLLMDEPFAALDAQTREILQSELLRIWDSQKKTIVFITHSLEEAIFLADRVAVMTARPGKVKEIIDIPLARPRPSDIRNSEEFVKLRQRAWAILKDEVDKSQQLNQTAASPAAAIPLHPSATQPFPADSGQLQEKAANQ
ncbi:ABC transporter ATP-binding protein [Paenibacillus radicis (ex Gao et al. 2016)]|uniref:ABC transporter ATP-binding protein n=1 Tax=Paenibacillus radicis (ex Gao et al. 2016) TaxID=1737354 RepID=A0A917M409_9BACL|nr:ABC transporter ATP-binding protein [Paenibacillus radicis (ex Gao et al. 2016)]GGG74081.1 ABC transporter ATP-binding protein [Paenibacillus radicis (ex Gao et al. 2016)]